MASIEEIGNKLIQKEIVPEEVLKELPKIRNSREAFFLALMEKPEVDVKKLHRFLCDEYRLPMVSLEFFEIDKDILSLIPEDIARRFWVIPLFEVDDKLFVASPTPLDIYTRDFLQGLTNHRIKQAIATRKDISDAISRLYITVESALSKIHSLSRKEEETEEKETYLQSLIKEAEKAPVVKLVNFILSQAIEHRASDIHIEPYEDRIVLRYRIDGVLYEYPAPPLIMHRAIVSRIKILSELDIAERRLPQSGRCEIEMGNKTVDLRVSIMPSIHGENVVIRVLDKTAVRLSLESLGFDQNFLAKLEKLIHKPYGMLLVTGPTGSGKTSTLYSILQRIMTPRKKIITIEDPVEFDFEGVTQIPVREDIGLTFGAVLRQVLRHDPDIIMLGEIRDLETGETAVRAALTGHLLLSTLHTNDAASAVTRLVDMGIPPFLVSSTLLGAIAQRLVRKLCSKCKEKYIPPMDVLKEIGVDPRAADEFNFCKPKGCPECNQSGYMGRFAIGEILVINEHIRSLIGTNSSSSTIKQAGIRFGMETMRVNSYRRFGEGLTSWEEVLAVTISD